MTSGIHDEGSHASTLSTATAEQLLREVEGELSALQESALALQGQLHGVVERTSELMSAHARIAGMMQRLHALSAGDLGAEAARSAASDRASQAAVGQPAVAPACAAHASAGSAASSLAGAGPEIVRFRQQLAYRELLLRLAGNDMARVQSLQRQASDLVHGVVDANPGCVSSFGLAEAGPPAPREDSDATVCEECLVVDDGALGPELVRRLGLVGCPAVVGSEFEANRRMLGQRFIGVAINLCTPNAWGILRRLHFADAGRGVPVVAYAMPQDSEKGFWFGSIDFAVAAPDETDLLEKLRQLAPHPKRILAMSSDVEVIEAVRKQLSAERISVSLVLDGRQVADMLPVVRPEAVVVHLSPRCMSVFGAVGALRAHAEWHDVPILFFLDEAAQPRDVAFLTVGVRMLAARGSCGSAALMEEVQRALLSRCHLRSVEWRGVA